MTLQQLRCFLEVVRQQLNITAAARTIYLSQSAVSRHIRTLEEELGVRLFSRTGNNLTQLTAEGEHLMGLARTSVEAADKLRNAAADLRDPAVGTLAIGTTHTQARYVLPSVISRFVARYPRVKLCLHQGTPQQVAAMAVQGEVDLVIATEAIEQHDELLSLPCYRWQHSILVRCDHPMMEERDLSLEALSRNPLVTYIQGFTGRSHLDEAFSRHGLHPNIVFSASDSDVIKTYVRQGVGIGIIAAMAYDPLTDDDLCAFEAGHLFPSSMTRLGLRRDGFLRRYGYDFIEMFAPHLTRERIERVALHKERREIDDCFTPVPVFPSHGKPPRTSS